ncbi:MAG: hypothetical protein K2J76_01080, partial [Oscillospiraceae bacterium]|nr:hypothetical protein [Oscillospiraceae bacterium]
MKGHIKIISAILLTAALSACGGNAPDISEIEETEIEEDDDIDENEEDETDFQTAEAEDEEEPDNTQSNGEYKYIVDGDHIKLTEYLGDEAEVTIPSEIDGVK